MKQVAWIEGDGVGPEVTGATIKVIEATKAPVEFVAVPAGEKAFAEHGTALPDELLETIRRTKVCLLYTSPSPRDATLSRMPSSA